MGCEPVAAAACVTASLEACATASGGPGGETGLAGEFAWPSAATDASLPTSPSRLAVAWGEHAAMSDTRTTERAELISLRIP